MNTNESALCAVLGVGIGAFEASRLIHSETAFNSLVSGNTAEALADMYVIGFSLILLMLSYGLRAPNTNSGSRL